MSSNINTYDEKTLSKNQIEWQKNYKFDLDTYKKLYPNSKILNVCKNINCLNYLQPHVNSCINRINGIVISI